MKRADEPEAATGAATTGGADEPEVAASAATTGGQEEETTSGAAATGVESERAPSPPRAPSGAPEGGDEEGAESPQTTQGATADPGAGALGTSTSAEVSSPRGDAGALALREPRHHVAHRGTVFHQAWRTLNELEAQYAEEELARAEERARLGEAWALLHERVESCRRQDAAARAAREEAIRFAK